MDRRILVEAKINQLGSISHSRLDHMKIGDKMVLTSLCPRFLTLLSTKETSTRTIMKEILLGGPMGTNQTSISRTHRWSLNWCRARRVTSGWLRSTMACKVTFRTCYTPSWLKRKIQKCYWLGIGATRACHAPQSTTLHSANSSNTTTPVHRCPASTREPYSRSSWSPPTRTITTTLAATPPRPYSTWPGRTWRSRMVNRVLICPKLEAPWKCIERASEKSGSSQVEISNNLYKFIR